MRRGRMRVRSKMKSPWAIRIRNKKPSAFWADGLGQQNEQSITARR